MPKPKKAILIDVVHPQITTLEAEKRLEELDSLTDTFGGASVQKIIQKRGVPDYETYVGKGKVQEILEICRAEKIKLVIINNLLKPRQLFKLEEIFRDDEIVVWDRIDLILAIFSKHAKTQEAKLQIELATIRHMGPRIYGMGGELMRQEGAVGARAGQGESNVEMMKRHLKKQELKILEKLEKHAKVHENHRKNRIRKNLKTAALVGYTNAGKSSLLTALTKKKVYIADELFATLSTRVGKLYIPDKDPCKRGTELLLSDTIGFIQDLPPDLIKAFKSTLAETLDADLLLHVIDATDERVEKKIAVVMDILKQLGLADKPQVYVFNKIDLIRDDVIAYEKREDAKRPPSLLRAGQEAAQALGWYHEDDDKAGKLVKTELSLKDLKKKYKEFTPICVSAHRKLNLEELVELLRLSTQN